MNGSLTVLINYLHAKFSAIKNSTQNLTKSSNILFNYVNSFKIHRS